MFLEALVVMAAVALVPVWLGGGPVTEVTRLIQRTAATSWLTEWVMFDAAARGHAEQIELPYWTARPHSALEVTDGGVEVVYESAAGLRRFAVAVSPRSPAAPHPGSGEPTSAVELRVDGRLAAALSGVAAVDVEPWVAPDGALLGVLLDLEGPDGAERRSHLRFGTPGGTL